jgi:RNA polymerase sigma-70 factor (ECF subfamily)
MSLQQELTDERNRRFLALLKPIDADCQRWAFNLAGNVQDAEDVYAQSILTGLEHIHQLKNDAAFKTWMFRVILNTHRQRIRQQKRVPEPMEQGALERAGPRDDEWEERSERSAVVRRALQKLSPDQRQALVLFEREELSIRGVSEVMGKKEGAVRVLLTRARTRMVELLKKEGISPELKPDNGGERDDDG